MTSQSVPGEQVANRLSDLAHTKLTPNSLVGSYFYSDAARGWRGCVVAEPSPGVYLVEVFGWLSYDSVEQVLINIEDMVDWRFYDNVTWLDNSLDDARRRWGADVPAADE